MAASDGTRKHEKWSPPSWAAWIEMEDNRPLISPTTSPPSRAAWIEMFVGGDGKKQEAVAAFTGGVD